MCYTRSPHDGTSHGRAFGHLWHRIILKTFAHLIPLVSSLIGMPPANAPAHRYATHLHEHFALTTPDTPRSSTSALSDCTLVFSDDIERHADSGTSNGSGKAYDVRERPSRDRSPLPDDFVSEIFMNILCLMLWSTIVSIVASILFVLAGIMALFGAMPYAVMFSGRGFVADLCGAVLAGCGTAIGTFLYHAFLAFRHPSKGWDWQRRSHIHISVMSGTATFAALLCATFAPPIGVTILPLAGLAPVNALAMSWLGLATLLGAGSFVYLVSRLARKMGCYRVLGRPVPTM